MKYFGRAFSGVVLFFSVWLFGFPPSAAAGSGMTFYAGLAVSSSRVEGADFDGLHFVTNETIWISIPELGSGMAAGVVLGGRGGWYGVEIGYLGSSHSGSFYDPRDGATAPIETTISRRIIYLDLTAFKTVFKRFEIFGVVGLCASQLGMVGNFFYGESYLVGNYDLLYKYYQRGKASLAGRGINIGFGVNVPVLKSLVVSVRAAYHPQNYDSASADFTDFYTNERIKQRYSFEDLKSSEWAVLAHLVYRFNLNL